MADLQPTQQQKTALSLLSSENAKAKILEVLKDKKKATSFVVSALAVINGNTDLREADSSSVYQAVMTAATMDLPINPNLGDAYIVPFKEKGVKKAQFQIGWKGFVKLAWRTGLYKTISVTEVYDGQLKIVDPLKGYTFDWEHKISENVVGYAAYFELLNGASKLIYMKKEEAEKHGKKYSQTYKNGFGVWKDNFDAMAKKTVLKQLLSKYAPLSIEMQTAILADQSEVKDFENGSYNYIDNDQIPASSKVELTPENPNWDKIKTALKSNEITLESLTEMYVISIDNLEKLQQNEAL